MSHWNYRVVKREWPELGEISFSIHEVYYEDGEIICWGPEAEGCKGDDLESLKDDIKWHMKALEKPVLNWEDMPGEGLDGMAKGLENSKD
ncbi:MAG: hypothetical protein ACXABY_14040 [Candidatus Thorarchaeota archaeon]|jgi:hypothetical protein